MSGRAATLCSSSRPLRRRGVSDRVSLVEMLPAVRSVPPGGAGESESGTAWTGEKRRKTTRPPSTLGSSDDDDADMMDIQHHPPEDDDSSSGLLVYSANDEISDEELDICLRKLQSCQPTIFVLFAPKIDSEQEQDELYERFCQLRMREYSKVMKLDDIHLPTGSKYPREIHTWGDPCRPDRIFDWTIDRDLFDLAELSDYQRIIPTREDYNEYYDWDEYRLTLSSYETDEDYVKYCDELSKRIKWVEENQHLDDVEFSKLKDRGFKQAMKIASKFSHLPYSLAVRGYEEHVWYMRRHKDRKGLDIIYFEIWKQVTKQKMDFKQALEEILATNMFPSRSNLIEAEIEGDSYFLSTQFEICMQHIPKNAELNDVLGHISHVIFKLLKPKTYAYYVKKKLEIGRRLQLTPTSRFT